MSFMDLCKKPNAITIMLFDNHFDNSMNADNGDDIKAH